LPEPLPVAAAAETVHLKRSLGRWDLVALFVVAVANLNVVPVIAAEGPVTIWLWMLALFFFFWPQGMAVVELSNRYPQEGGIYLWTKKFFGDFHGFLSGWCYWTNNIFYIPTLLVIVVGISGYAGGARTQMLGSDKVYVAVMSVVLLWVMIWLNIRGLSVGKWINNLGGIGTAITSVVLVALALGVLRTHGGMLHAADFSVRGRDWHLINSFGFICFGLVGLELASVMFCGADYCREFCTSSRRSVCCWPFRKRKSARCRDFCRRCKAWRVDCRFCGWCRSWRWC
jgi:amino acid transporter